MWDVRCAMKLWLFDLDTTRHERKWRKSDKKIACFVRRKKENLSRLLYVDVGFDK